MERVIDYSGLYERKMPSSNPVLPGIMLWAGKNCLDVIGRNCHYSEGCIMGYPNGFLQN